MFKDLRPNAFENDMKERKNQMQIACTHHGLDKPGEDPLHQPNPWEYFIAETKDMNIVWCNVFKSASSR